MKRRKLLNILFTVISILSLAVIGILLYMFFQSNKYVRYEDPQGRFSIKYPAGWTYKENTKGAAVVFLTPKQGEMDPFNENVNIIAQDLPEKHMGIKEHSDFMVGQMRMFFGENIEILKAEPMRIDHKEGFQLVFIGSNFDPKLQYKSVWTIDGRMAYQITYTAAYSQYEVFLKQVDKMIASFDIK